MPLPCILIKLLLLKPINFEFLVRNPLQLRARATENQRYFEFFFRYPETRKVKRIFIRFHYINKKHQIEITLSALRVTDSAVCVVDSYDYLLFDNVLWLQYS